MKSGNSQYSDIDIMLGKFIQDRYGLYKNVEKSFEGFEMMTKKTLDQ